MANEITSNGNYAVKETGESINYEFTFRSFDSLDDAVETLGEAKVLALVQRMEKVDANNTAREKAKSVNGHSTRVVLSEEQKAEKKAQRGADKALLAKINALSDEQRAELGL